MLVISLFLETQALLICDSNSWDTKLKLCNLHIKQPGTITLDMLMSNQKNGGLNFSLQNRE